MRYRTLAEVLGVLLVKQAREKKLNVMVETSGRDVAMFKYVDQFFPEDQYRKLVVHFSINDITHAERSVDTRMEKEMRDGARALDMHTRELIKANAGGPYGSAVLKGVQADSQRVWESVREGMEGNVGKTWLKASVKISGHESEEWSACAANASPDGEPFRFEKR